MQDKLPLISQSQASLTDLTFANTESSYRHHVSTFLRSSSARKPDGILLPKPKCFLSSIPNESLTHITTFIDHPPSLFALSRVSRRLRDHVADDNTWYRAFVFHYLGVGPEHDPQGDTKLMLRRTESSWKKEFVVRFNLTRRWKMSRNATLSYQPNYWGVSSMHLLENASLLTSNLQYGIVTRSFPLTGKILRGYLDASGTTNGLGIGNPNEEFTPNVSCTALASCGGTGRIAWGFLNGDVATTSALRVMDTNRAAARYVRCQVADGHTGLVCCVLFAGKDDGLVVSGCTHGEVKLWDAKRMRCLWTGFAKMPDAVRSDPCLKIEHCGGAGALVAALESGDIVVWRGFQFEDACLADQVPADSIQEFTIAAVSRSVPVELSAIDYLFVDPNSSPSKVRLLLHHTDQCYFLRLVVDFPSGQVTRTTFCDGPLGPLTSLKPCYAIRDGGRGVSSVAPTPVAPGMPSLTVAQAAGHFASSESSFVLAGDSLGTVCVWNWDAEGLSVTAKEQALASVDVRSRVPSSRKWEAHDDGAVCAIEANGIVIVTGSTHGTLKTWDCLTLASLRSFSTPFSKPTATGEWIPVGQIAIRGDLLVASLGSRILVWQGGVVASDKKSKGKHARKSKRRATGGFLNKWQQQIELNKDIRESQRFLDDERAYTQRALGRERDQRSTLDELGLDEREAVEYLLMLSREEAAQRRPSEIGAGLISSGSGEGETITMPANDDMEEVFTLDEHTDFGHSQPFGHGGRSQTPLPNPDTSYLFRGDHCRSKPRAASSQSNSKVQVSPPFVPEPTEAVGTSPPHLRTTQSGGTSPHSMGTSRGSGVSMSSSSASLLSTSSDAATEPFPAIESSSGTPSRSVSSHHLAGSWSRGSPCSSIGDRQHRENRGGGDGQSLPPQRSVSLSWPGLAHDPDRADGIPGSEKEDEELELVLALSLAEARSGGEV